MKRNIKKAITLMICLCYVFFAFTDSMAEEISGRKDDLDIIFVVDISGSMRTNDPDGIALEMVKAFIDTVHKDHARVGFVAYNDQIVSAAAPVSISKQEERDELKEQINAITYRGNTDIGLALSHAYSLMPKEQGRDSIIVLISDGESDLAGSTTGRTLEQSNQELEQMVATCADERIPIYTITFGNYSGSKEVLQSIASRTGAKNHEAKSPESLIEILYDIFENKLSYKIRQFSVGRYATGSQEINYTVDEAYLDEINVLLISPQMIGNTAVRYGEDDIYTTKALYYAVAKVSREWIESSNKSLTVTTETVDGQRVEAYVIGYRDLEPILNIDTEVAKNQEVAYQIYFKDLNGTIIRDKKFYERFTWELSFDSAEAFVQQLPEDNDGILAGVVKTGPTGVYGLQAILTDSLGGYQFQTALHAVNSEPVGALPETNCTILSRETVYNLDDWFIDADGDRLQYSLHTDSQGIEITDNQLSIKPQKSGNQTITIGVSDGENQLDYQYEIQVISLWSAYWWVIMLFLLLLVAAFILRKLRHKPQAKAEVITDIKSSSCFNGRLDLYFTMLPEEDGEIPPLVFHMYKLRDSKVRLSDLLKEYPAEVKALDLSQVCLVADEGRRMILFHSAQSTIMAGNSIMCRQVRYSVSFGDVIYITSADGAYELELHYISMIQ